ncbi:outer membrane protein assembly factor BamD [Carnimonas bestiolae]|uniref:outer membrane protein assembly factor BamD n=1 Tax=Carnimonas bestiolae TaxID=3402172 RepID=UPI003EDB73C3
MRAYQLSALALVAAVLVGCGGNTKPVADLPEQQLYQQAQQSLNNGRYSAAVTQLETLDSRYPFSQNAENVQLDLIYGYYQVNNWDSTIASAGRFIRLHPDNAQVDYAYYLRGLANWQAGRFGLEGLDLVSISTRDLGATNAAYKDFNELITRFPQSRYAPDARQRIIYLRNLTAQHELEVADFYLRKRDYVAAIERGRWVISHYPQTPANYDALASMVEGYMGLNMDDRARETLAVLIHNKPDYKQLNGTTFKTRHLGKTLSLDG